jgi:tRNA wybutosine-synthesizing protein 1
MTKPRKRIRKETYEPVLKHSAVQLCNWTKKSLKDEGVCFKEKFYGIKSHLCCQMTCSILCNNRCIHCWRDISNAEDKMIEFPDEPKEILEGAIKAQQKLLTGFKIDPNSKSKQLSKANQKKLEEAQTPNQFALSLTGEPTLYPKIGELIEEIKSRNATSFLVTNGLQPGIIKKLIENNQLPTRLYVSVNSSNKVEHEKFHRSLKKDAWEKLRETLNLFPTIKNERTTVFRINLVKDLNMENKFIKEFAELIKMSKPFIIEIKGFMSVGFARERLGYEKMPAHSEMLEWIGKLEEKLSGSGYKLLDEHEASRAYVLGKDKNALRIREEDY